ncbi:MAG: hypothetical protein K2X39_09355 [Silvanigrellaceae bacterium]|nr:hypothetical protein [Silvanigrellaceae bacterium]
MKEKYQPDPIDKKIYYPVPDFSIFPAKKSSLVFDNETIVHPIKYNRLEEGRRGKLPADSRRYVIYPLANLNDLLNQLKIDKSSQGINSYSTKKIRYLVTTNYQLMFALEGFPNDKVPHHYHMCGEEKNNAYCLGAGTIFLERNLDQFQITIINHQSGDFSPPVDSLKWVLALLLANESLLPGENFFPDTLKLIEMNAKGSYENDYLTDKVTLTKSLSRHIELVKEIIPISDNIYGPDYNKPQETEHRNGETLNFQCSTKRRRINDRFNHPSPNPYYKVAQSRLSRLDPNRVQQIRDNATLDKPQELELADGIESNSNIEIIGSKKGEILLSKFWQKVPELSQESSDELTIKNNFKATIN